MATTPDVATTRETMTAYLDALINNRPYADFFADDVTFTLMGSDQVTTGRAAVEGAITYLHQQAFTAAPRLVTLLTADAQAVVEAVFVGTHTGEFAGVAATGRPVEVPYAVVYDMQGDKIAALRIYMPVNALMQQITAG